MRAGWFVCCAVLLAANTQAAPPGSGGYGAASAAQARPLPPAQRLERRFLQIAAANLRFQSEASRLATDRSPSPAVKDLANTLLARQETAQPEMVRLLHARGMAMPIPSSAHGKVLKQLAKLGGAKFDRAYVDEVALRSTQEDIANYEKMSAHAEDPVLKAWVDRQLPTLRYHLAKAGRALPAASSNEHRVRPTFSAPGSP
jgi:putative membrane protein